jgi:drug/metabolite transporter (DMT)-like permease
MDSKDWALLLLLAVLWGGAFFFAGVAVRELPPLTVVLARVALAATTLLPLYFYLGYALPKSVLGWLPFFGMGLLNNAIPFGFIFAGQVHISVGLSSIINAITPLFTIVVMAVFQEESLTTNRVIGVLLGIGGVAALHGLDGGGIEGAQTLGMAFCLAGALSYGFAALWGRRHLADVPPLKSATCQLICSTMVMTLVVAFIDRPWSLDFPSLNVVLSLFALAVFGTAIAYVLFFRILVRAGASNVMLVTLVIPIVALILAHIFLGEVIQFNEVVGALSIGLGLVFIDGRLIDWIRRRPPAS